MNKPVSESVQDRFTQSTSKFHFMNSATNNSLVKYCLRIADSSLVLGQRLGEWCGHGPILEEDIALTNISLDLIGQARAFYTYAAQLENQGKTEDDFAFFGMKGNTTISCLQNNRMVISDKQFCGSF